MSFGQPIWLWGLLVLPALAFFFARAEQVGTERLRRFVAARLLPQLAGTVNRTRRIMRFILLLLVLALVIVSLARPRWGYAFDEVKRKGLDLLLAVDVSRSMLSNDVQPNRLERVKLATQDLLNELQGDRVGLIAFAGKAFLQAPLTIDYDAAVDSINELDTKIIPEGGTNISDAIALATRTFGKSATGNRALIIFTDGEELSGDAVQAAKAAADAGVRIFTVGVGTPAGSLIPIEGESGGTAFVKDAQGQVVKSKLDETRLREVAQAAGGFYVHLENGPRTMKQLFSDGLAKMQVADINARLSRRAIERYEWPLSAAILFFALALLINDRKGPRTARRRPEPKRSIAAAAAVLFVAAGGWARAASPGLQLYEEQKFPEAYEHFQKTLQENPGARPTDRIQFDAGAAAYKMKDYNKALQSFSQALLSKDPTSAEREPLQPRQHALRARRSGKERRKKTEQLGKRASALRGNAQSGTAKQEREGQLRVRQEEDRGAEEEAGTKTDADTIAIAIRHRLRLRRKRTRRTIKSRTTRISNKTKTSSRRTRQQKDQQQQSQNGQGSGAGQKSDE